MRTTSILAVLALTATTTQQHVTAVVPDRTLFGNAEPPRAVNFDNSPKQQPNNAAAAGRVPMPDTAVPDMAMPDMTASKTPRKKHPKPGLATKLTDEEISKSNKAREYAKRMSQERKAKARAAAEGTTYTAPSPPAKKKKKNKNKKKQVKDMTEDEMLKQRIEHEQKNKRSDINMSDFENIIGALRETVKQNPTSAEAVSELAMGLHKWEQEHHQGGNLLDEAVSLYREALALNPGTELRIGVQLNVLDALLVNGRTAEALAEANELEKDPAVTSNPDIYSRMLYIRGRAHRGSRNRDGELADLFKAIDLNPSSSMSYEAIVHLADAATYVKYGVDLRQFVDHMKALSTFLLNQGNRPDTTEASRMMFSTFFALDAMIKGNVEAGEDLKSPKNAALVAEGWNALAKGNDLMKDKIWPDSGYNREHSEMQMQSYKMVFSKSMMELAENGYRDPEGRRLIFVVGLPRSGSTLLEQIFHAHSLVSGIGENSQFNVGLEKFRDELNDAISSQAIDRVQSVLRRHGKSVVERTYNMPINEDKSPILVDKMLFNFWSIGFIRMMLPEAKIVHVRKSNKMDHMFSLYKRQFERGTAPWCYDFDDMAHFFTMYEGIMDHWNTIMPDQILNIAYEDLVNEKEKTTRMLAKFADLEFEEGMLSAHKVGRTVLTHSSAQVGKPIYKSAIGAWEVYGDHMPVDPALADSYSAGNGEL